MSERSAAPNRTGLGAAFVFVSSKARRLCRERTSVLPLDFGAFAATQASCRAE
jgi:hypothetical protein